MSSAGSRRARYVAIAAAVVIVGAAAAAPVCQSVLRRVGTRTRVAIDDVLGHQGAPSAPAGALGRSPQATGPSALPAPQAALLGGEAPSSGSRVRVAQGPRAPAATGGGRAIQRPGVSLVYSEGVDETYLDPIAGVVSAATAAYERRFPASAKTTLHVDVRPAAGWYESTITDRRDTIYVHLGRKGLGEYMRGDAGPVGILCQAVAELHNPRRVAGLDRFVTHRYLVPAVVAELGPEVVPITNATPMAPDGPPMLDLLTDDAYATVHPDFAAARALAAIDDAIQPEGLASFVAGIPADADDPFAALRQAAIAKAPKLADVFQTYDEASRIELQPDGKVLVASFEANEIVSGVVSHPLSALHDPLVAVVSREFQMSQTDEWAADGALSLKLYAQQPRAYINWEIADPDWKLKDWRPYSAFEMDLRLDGIEPQRMSVRAYDEVGLGHAVLYLWAGTLRPGEERHLRCNLADANRRAAKSPQADYFGGKFRESEVAIVIVILYEPTQPLTLYVDNLRLIPRTVAAAPR